MGTTLLTSKEWEWLELLCGSEARRARRAGTPSVQAAFNILATKCASQSELTPGERAEILPICKREETLARRAGAFASCDTWTAIAGKLAV